VVGLSKRLFSTGCPAALLVGLGFALSGCSTVLFTRTADSQIYTDAVYQKSQPFFFFGIVGKPLTIVVEQICLGKEIDQLSTEYTGEDVLVGVLTLGIYAPRTVKVWCQI